MPVSFRKPHCARESGLDREDRIVAGGPDRAEPPQRCCWSRCVRNSRPKFCPMPVFGNIGPRGDGYFPDQMMTGDEAMRYHAFQCDLSPIPSPI